MTEELKARIAQINAGTAPAGYKKTKVGIVPEEWSIKRLSEIALVIDGTHQTPEYVDDGVPFVSVENIADIYGTEKYISEDAFSLFKYKPQKNDILMTRITAGIIGDTCIVQDDRPLGYYVSLALIRIKTSDLVEYINQFINGIVFKRELNKRIIHTAFPKKINLTDINDCKLYLPPLPEQQKIAEILTAQDAVIALMQKQKKAFLQKMFPQKGCTVPEIRFAEFTDAWEQRKLGDIIDKLTGGASIAPDDYVDEGYRTIPKGAINDTGVADMSGCKCVTEAFYRKNISSKTSTGELLTSLRDLVPTAPNMGRIVRIYGYSEDFLMPQGAYSIKLKTDSDEDFIIAYSNSPEYRKTITTKKNGSTQVHIRNGEFLNIDIIVPSYEEQKIIGLIIKNLDNLITLHQRKLEIEQQKKKALMQLLLTGKVRCV